MDRITTILVALAATSPLFAWPTMPMDRDELVLRAAGVPTKTSDLMQWLDQRCPNETDLARLNELVEALGSRNFKERDRASKTLVQTGIAAQPILLAATKNPNAEIRQRARHCLRAINDREAEKLVPAVVRVLVKRRVPEAVALLLRYLPLAPVNGAIEEEIAFGLERLASVSKEMPVELAAALDDSVPQRRAIAACIVGSLGNRAERAQVRKLMQDPDSTVRLRAAQGLLVAREKDAIPVLIALLDKTPLYLAWQAEELLRWAADGTAPRSIVYQAGEVAKRCKEEWEKWCRESKRQIDFDAMATQPRRPCLFFIRAADSSVPAHGPAGSGFRAFGSDGHPRWHSSGSLDARYIWEFLPNGRLLVTSITQVQARGKHEVIKEIDWTGHVYWQFVIPWPHSAVVLVERLRDGRTHFVLRAMGHGFLARDSGDIIIPPRHDPAKVPLVRIDQFRQERQTAFANQMSLHDGNRLTFEAHRTRAIETDPGGRIVGESFAYHRYGRAVQVILPLIRLGFTSLPNRDYDLRTSLEGRIRQLYTDNLNDWYLAINAIAQDFRNGGEPAIPALMRARGKMAAMPSGGGDLSHLVSSVILSVSSNPVREAAELANSDDPFTRAGAIFILGLTKWKNRDRELRWSAIKKALGDSHEVVRFAAVIGLRAFRDQPEVIRPLLRSMVGDSDKVVRKYAESDLSTLRQ